MPANYDLHALDIMVVEGHYFMRRLLASILRELGVRSIRQARYPEEAFKMFRDRPPDLVMTDWAPDLDGLSLLQRIRNDPDSPDPYAPVILLTAHTELDHVCAARDAGVTEFLAKPVHAKLIYLRICSVIERQRVFIRSLDFFGPDRRRRRAEFDGPDRRNHANHQGFDRRVIQLPFSGPERRQGYPGYRAPDRRGGARL